MSTKYTLVQHSAYGHNSNPQFRAAVELKAVTTAAAQNTITRLGGLLFDTYRDADTAEYTENYPPGTDDIIPAARGTFADMELDGLRLYIPTRVGEP